MKNTEKLIDFLNSPACVELSQKEKNTIVVKHKIEELISKTPTGELREELSEINILLNL